MPDGSNAFVSDCIAGPRGLFQSAELALYDRILAGQAATLAYGATEAVDLYSKGTAS